MGHLSNAEVLERTGWARSVGGASPYVSLFARNGSSREMIDEDVAKLHICELPSARSCTYVLPAIDFALGLKVGESFSAKSEIAVAKRLFNFGEAEIAVQSAAVLEVLGNRTLDPKAIKAELGDVVANFGEEGKKRGLSNSLAISLGLLQTAGKIVRVPIEGRLDRQRYAYRIWHPSPNLALEPQFDPYRALARAYFQWIGPATIAQFQWFAGLSGTAAKAATKGVSLVEVEPGSGYFLLEEDIDAFTMFETPCEPSVALVASIDSILMLRRNVSDHLDASDNTRQMQGEKMVYELAHIAELTNHAIIDRGRLVGLWEFDPFAQELVYKLFVDRTPAFQHAIESMQEFAKTNLGDVRSFSLDSPESRRGKIASLRAT